MNVKYLSLSVDNDLCDSNVDIRHIYLRRTASLTSKHEPR